MAPLREFRLRRELETRLRDRRRLLRDLEDLRELEREREREDPRLRSDLLLDDERDRDLNRRELTRLPLRMAPLRMALASTLAPLVCVVLEYPVSAVPPWRAPFSSAPVSAGVSTPFAVSSSVPVTGVSPAPPSEVVNPFSSPPAVSVKPASPSSVPPRAGAVQWKYIIIAELTFTTSTLPSVTSSPGAVDPYASPVETASPPALTSCSWLFWASEPPSA